MTPPDATWLLRLYTRWRLPQLLSLDPVAAQRKTLFRLLAKARHTRFGRAHGFDAMRTVEDFQKQVPLRRYEDFWKDWWAPSFPTLDNLSWPGRIPFFALTSGTTTGTTKTIPVSKEMVRANRRAALDILVWHLRHFPHARPLAGKTLILGGSTALTKLAGGAMAGDLSGIAAKTIPFWAKPYTAPGTELALLSDWDEKLDKIAQYALFAPVRVLSDTPSWLLLLFERVLEKRGHIGPAFPQLELLIHGGVNFEPYRARFQEYLRPTGAVTREVYPASEGFIGMEDAGPGEGLRLLLDNGIFYEFVPADELSSPSPPRHWVENLETEVDYAIVLSTCAGLWGAVLGDTVRFIERSPPRFFITGRVSWSLSAFGEHLSAGEIEEAASAVAKTLGMHIRDFCVGASFPEDAPSRGRHVFLIELEEALQEEARTFLQERFSALVDQELCRRNEDYRTHRQKDVQLLCPEIIFLPPGVFVRWMRRRGMLGGQHKVPRIVSDPARFSQMREEILAS